MNQNFANRLDLDVFTSTGQNFRGSVTDAQVENETAVIVAEFPTRNAPPMHVGEGVSLSFPGLQSGEPFHSPAQIVTRIEDRLRLRYRFEVGRSVGAVLAPLADWRFATRVQPFPNAPVSAAVERCDGGSRFTARVQDISATGIALHVSTGDEPRLFSVWQLKVWLQLPGVPHEFLMMGNVCYRRPAKNHILYGIDFDSVATVDFGKHQATIHKYVSNCQATAIHMLRQALPARKAA